jgi:predicted metal-dependent phosphotriesterase family hydrolase
MNIQTVTGLVPVESIKLADAHAHAWIQPPPGVDPDCPNLNDFDSILLELDEFRQAGGTLLVDCQPGGCGRDARMLVKLSEATGLYITAITGFHLRKYYPLKNWLWQASETQAMEHFVEELKGGMIETGSTVPAAAIKVGYEGMIDGQFRVLMEAATEASLQTGAGLLFHTEQGLNVEALLPFFTDRHISANRLYFCHMDKRSDIGLHRELALAGVLLGYDTFLRRKYNPEANLWPLLKEMVQSGLGQRVALGLDAALPGMWAHMGGEWGLLALPQLIVPRLRQEGITETVIADLTGQNVARWLART